jgi:hypothetical protein
MGVNRGERKMGYVIIVFVWVKLVKIQHKVQAEQSDRLD